MVSVGDKKSTSFTGQSSRARIAGKQVEKKPVEKRTQTAVKGSGNWKLGNSTRVPARSATRPVSLSLDGRGLQQAPPAPSPKGPGKGTISASQPAPKEQPVLDMGKLTDFVNGQIAGNKAVRQPGGEPPGLKGAQPYNVDAGGGVTRPTYIAQGNAYVKWQPNGPTGKTEWHALGPVPPGILGAATSPGAQQGGAVQASDSVRTAAGSQIGAAAQFAGGVAQGGAAPESGAGVQAGSVTGAPSSQAGTRAVDPMLVDKCVGARLGGREMKPIGGKPPNVDEKQAYSLSGSAGASMKAFVADGQLYARQQAPGSKPQWFSMGAAPPPGRPVDLMQSSAGFKAMAPIQQQQLSTLMTGQSPMARQAQEKLALLVTQPEYARAGTEAQAQQLRRELSGNSVVPSQANVSGNLKPAPGGFQLSKPEAVPVYTFRGTTGAAVRQDVTVNGHQVPVYAPSDGKYDLPNQYSTQDVGKMLASIPKESLALIKKIELSPTANPDDAAWQKQFGDKGHTSFMTCGENGVVTIYPSSGPMKVPEGASAIIHETGHAWSMAKWGSDERAPAWKPWSKAMQDDGLAVSAYGSNNMLEDTAELTALYLGTKGNNPSAHAEYRRLYPNRFALLDQQFGASQ